MAAQQGHPVCEFNTGVCYRDGLGCEQSFVQAAEWWEKAAGQGYAYAKMMPSPILSGISAYTFVQWRDTQMEPLTDFPRT